MFLHKVYAPLYYAKLLGFFAPPVIKVVLNSEHTDLIFGDFLNHSNNEAGETLEKLFFRIFWFGVNF